MYVLSCRGSPMQASACPLRTRSPEESFMTDPGRNIYAPNLLAFTTLGAEEGEGTVSDDRTLYARLEIWDFGPMLANVVSWFQQDQWSTKLHPIGYSECHRDGRSQLLRKDGEFGRSRPGGHGTSFLLSSLYIPRFDVVMLLKPRVVALSVGHLFSFQGDVPSLLYSALWSLKRLSFVWPATGHLQSLKISDRIQNILFELR